jgi:restriction system protein
METRIGGMEVSYTSRGACTYRLELWHDGLKKHRVIKGNDASIVERKARLQVNDWAGKWAAAQDREALRQERTQKKEHQESQKALAAERTAEAQAAFAALENILAHTLGADDTIDWETLNDRSDFPELRPSWSLCRSLHPLNLIPGGTSRISPSWTDYSPREGRGRSPMPRAAMRLTVQRGRIRWTAERKTSETATSS